MAAIVYSNFRQFSFLAIRLNAPFTDRSADNFPFVSLAGLQEDKLFSIFSGREGTKDVLRYDF